MANEVDSISAMATMLGIRDQNDMLGRVTSVRRSMGHLARFMAQKRDIVNALTSVRVPLFAKNTITYIFTASEHLTSASAELDNFREELSNAQNIYLAKVSIGEFWVVNV